MVWLDGQRLQRSMIGKLVVRRSEEKVCGKPLQIGREFDDLCSMWRLIKRVTVAENDFCNQVWPILYGDPYFSSHSCHCLVGSWINGHDSRNGGYTWAQHHGLPLNKANLATPTAECPILAENCRRDQHKPPQVILFSRWNHPATAGYLHWDTSIMKRAALISFKIDTSSWYGFVFPNAPDKTISCGLQDALTHPNGIPHSVTSDQVIYFTKNEV